MKYAFVKRPKENTCDLRRASALFCLILGVCSYLAVRLYDLAVYDDPVTEVLSGQYTRTRQVVSHTGFVFDRNGRLFSHTESGAVAVVNPVSCDDKNRVAEFLAEHSQNDLATMLEKLTTPEPFTVTCSEFPEETAPDGVFVYRRYAERDDGFCRHLLGYRNGDGVGMDGVLRVYDTVLSALDATVSYRYNADAMGGSFDDDMFCMINRAYDQALPPDGLILSLDGELQEHVDRVCDRYLDMGAVVVCDLADFSIAALSSRPVYDRGNIAASLNSDRAELINRAFSLYTPGSVFKTVVAAAALEFDEALYDFSYECTGSTVVSEITFRCHEHDGHGSQTMREGYANSCNTYFIALAERIGLSSIVEMAERMGLGTVRAFDGLSAPAARIPDLSTPQGAAYLANISFGQGDLLVSPMDMLMVQSISVTGRKSDFSLVKGRNADGQTDYFSAPVVRQVLNDGTVEKLRRMMRYCVTNGTGRAAFSAEVAVGGKTATAQSGQYKDGSEVLHRWFTGAFPIDEPRYSVVVLCDGNGENTASPARIFKEISDCFSRTMFAENTSGV